MKIRDPFWSSASVLLGYKRQLGISLSGALVSALCFGGGLGMVLPTLQLLLGQRQPLGELVNRYLGDPDNPAWLQELAQWLGAHVPTDPFLAFLLVMATLGGLTIVGSLGRYVHELMILTVVARSVLVWRTRLFRRLIHARLDHAFQGGTADNISRITNDVAVLGRGYHAVLGKAIAKIFNGTVAILVAVWVDWRLTLIALIGAPAIAVLLRTFGRKTRRASMRLMQKSGRMISMLSESLGGIRVVKVHHAEGYERRRFGRLNRDLYAQEMRLRQIRAVSGPLVETLGLFGVMAVASIAAWYIFHLDVPPERFMTVLAAVAGAGTSLKPLSTLHIQLHESEAAASRVLELLQTPVEDTLRRNDKTSRPTPLARHHRDITFDSVSYVYPGQSTPVVREVTLHVRHGQTVAVVGANGAGKTTLLSLLPRLIDPTQGRVLIDGHDITLVNPRSLRRQLAVVTQQNVLFEGTIAQNIAYGRRHERHEKIVAAARGAYADDFINPLPNGYDTVLGEHGQGLSGGQKQRLCIARAILRDPAILILDEATSQIDADSEAKINQALNRLRHGRTTFIIAHRLSTVIDADNIVVMADGRVVDQGTHTQLLARCDTYRTLTQTQLQAHHAALPSQPDGETPTPPLSATTG